MSRLHTYKTQPLFCSLYLEILLLRLEWSLLLVVFSACGGIRTGNGKPVLTVYFSVLACGILGKGGLFVAPPLEDCLNGQTGSSTLAGTGCTDCQALTWPKWSYRLEIGQFGAILPLKGTDYITRFDILFWLFRPLFHFTFCGLSSHLYFPLLATARKRFLSP